MDVHWGHESVHPDCIDTIIGIQPSSPCFKQRSNNWIKTKTAGHYSDTPQNKLRLEAKKPTSVFTGEGSGIYLTQMAWAEGKPIKGNPNKKEHNFGVTTGFGPNGGAQGLGYIE